MNNIQHDTLFKKMEEWAPVSLAYEWDPVGLQVGNAAEATKKVMITLDVTEAVVDEAAQYGVNLIISHHPLLFKAVQHIDAQSPKGKIIQKLLKYDITVYASHTNLDIAEGGVNDMLASALAVKQTRPLLPTQSESFLKVVVFVPEDYASSMKEALGNSGAGHIGNYSHCSFETDGTGSFKPLEGSNPFIGNPHQVEEVKERRIETIVEENKLSETIQVMKEAHPYEEVAYDVYPVQQSGKTYGLGRIGEVDSPVSLLEFCEHVKSALDMDHLRFAGDENKPIQKVAILGGSGEKYISRALEQYADVYITGDTTFHPVQDAIDAGLAVIDAGHYIEKVMKEHTRKYIINEFPDLDVVVSAVNTNPYQFI